MLHLGNVEFAIDEDGETTAHSTPQGEAAVSTQPECLDLRRQHGQPWLRQLSTRRSAKASVQESAAGESCVWRDTLVQNMLCISGVVDSSAITRLILHGVLRMQHSQL